jgi:1-acyl-sn-glycerol-3-phosphate acyltransferase
MAVIRSFLFAIVFYCGSMIAVFGAMVAAWWGPMAVRRYGLGWARFHRWCARVLLGIESRVEGEVPLDPVIIAAKHQSMYETLELLLILPAPAMVLKRELADLPLWGKIAMAYGGVPVDREGSAKALKDMVAASKEMVAEGRSIVIFPEGTRVAPGTRPPLRAGFAGLYRILKCPVVPVAVNSGLVWPRGAIIKKPGVVTFRFGERIPADLPRAEAEAKVFAAINALEA